MTDSQITEWLNSPVLDLHFFAITSKTRIRAMKAVFPEIDSKETEAIGDCVHDEIKTKYYDLLEDYTNGALTIDECIEEANAVYKRYNVEDIFVRVTAIKYQPTLENMV